MAEDKEAPRERNPIEQKMFNMYRITYEFTDKFGKPHKRDAHCNELNLELYKQRILETGHKIIKVERLYWN